MDRFFVTFLLSAFFALPVVLLPVSLHVAEPGNASRHAALKNHDLPLAVRHLPDTRQQNVAGSPAAPPTPHSDTQQHRPTPKRPKVALIIDDMGYNRKVGHQLLALELPLSFSFLPQAPYTRELVQRAQQQNRTILVHLPMEPKAGSWKEEPVTLKTGDSEKELQKKMRQMLGAVPQARGANNHMGSGFTEQRQKMATVLSLIQQKHLFFVDSYTSGASSIQEVAQRLGIPTARRRIFLDNEQTVAAICSQFNKLALLAAKETTAIAIGHPNQAMADALTSCAPRNLADVDIVSVELLVHE